MTPLLDTFIPGQITNPLNDSSWGLWKHRRQVKTAREKAGMCLLMALQGKALRVPADAPKRITFHRYGHNLFDGDGYQAAMKPYRDALKDAQVINDDRDSAGHAFVYEQEISRGKRARRGVQITVTIMESAHAAHPDPQARTPATSQGRPALRPDLPPLGQHDPRGRR